MTFHWTRCLNLREMWTSSRRSCSRSTASSRCTRQCTKQNSSFCKTACKVRSMSEELRYQTGFGNEFATEADAGGLPQGQNAPQKHALGVYTEQCSGCPFTAPRAANRRTWTYRIRPSVTHRPYEEIPARLIRSGPFVEVPTSPNQ